MRRLVLFFVLAITVLPTAQLYADDNDKLSYEASVMEWREGRLDRLMAETGFLNLAGLFWLRDGSSSFGSSEDSKLVFPASAPAAMGEFVRVDGGIEMRVAEGVDVRVDGAPVSEVFMADDTTEAPVTASHGSLAWVVIQRAGRYAVRLRDFENPALSDFPPLPYYDIDPAYRVTGTLKPYDEPKVMQVNTVIEGLGWEPKSPGLVEFVIDGNTYALEAYESGERLFFVFGDLTNRNVTYPAGRFLYAEKPGDDGTTVLDFNESYSPPCAFNDFSTCPVASPSNRLPVALPVGEKYSKENYVGDY